MGHQPRKQEKQLTRGGPLDFPQNNGIHDHLQSCMVPLQIEAPCSLASSTLLLPSYLPLNPFKRFFNLPLNYLCSLTMASERFAMSSTQNVVSRPLEMKGLSPFDHKISMAKRYAHDGVVAGAKAAVVASVATAIPTLASVRMLPWARYNLNPTAQALIISTVAGAAYFIVADKTVLASARKNSFKDIQA